MFTSPQLTPQSVRGCTLADTAAIVALQSICYGQELRESEAAFAGKISACAETCFLVPARDGISAYLISLPCENYDLPAFDATTYARPESPNTLYIHDLAVNPDARGRNLGRVLLDAAFEKAKVLGISEVCLLAVQGSAPFWGKLGFVAVQDLGQELTQKVRSYGEDAVFMRKSL